MGDPSSVRERTLAPSPRRRDPDTSLSQLVREEAEKPLHSKEN